MSLIFYIPSSDSLVTTESLPERKQDSKHVLVVPFNNQFGILNDDRGKEEGYHDANELEV